MNAPPTIEERQWGMYAHAITLIVAFVTGAGWLAALIIYLIKKDNSKFVAFHAVQALAIQIITVLLFYALIFFGVITLGIGFFIVLPVILVVLAVMLFYQINAAIEANKGNWYEIPFVSQFATKYKA